MLKTKHQAEVSRIITNSTNRVLPNSLCSASSYFLFVFEQSKLVHCQFHTNGFNIFKLDCNSVLWGGGTTGWATPNLICLLTASTLRLSFYAWGKSNDSAFKSAGLPCTNTYIGLLKLWFLLWPCLFEPFVMLQMFFGWFPRVLCSPWVSQLGVDVNFGETLGLIRPCPAAVIRTQWRHSA